MSKLSNRVSHKTVKANNAEKALHRIEKELNQLIFKSPQLNAKIRLTAYDLKNDVVGVIRKLYEKGDK